MKEGTRMKKDMPRLQQLLCASALEIIYDLREFTESSGRALRPIFASVRSLFDGITTYARNACELHITSPVVTCPSSLKPAEETRNLD